MHHLIFSQSCKFSKIAIVMLSYFMLIYFIYITNVYFINIGFEIMGNSNNSNSFFAKGQGLRIISIKRNSPFDGKVQPFFDFIIDIIPQVQQRSPKQILDKLTGEKQVKSVNKNFAEIIAQNQDKPIQFKIVSTKLRNVRSIEITPNRNWNGSHDLIGVILRKQKFDEAFDNYFPVTDIAMNSPVQAAGIKQGQYLLGVIQFAYPSLNNFIQNLYDRFFDKQVADKTVHFAVYDIVTDQVFIKQVLLKRGWGGKGLLGCQFLQGHVNKFPQNFLQYRNKLLQAQKIKVKNQKLKHELGECNGASKSLVQALKRNKNKKGKHLQMIKSLIDVKPPEIPKAELMKWNNAKQNQMMNQSEKRQKSREMELIQQQGFKIVCLQTKVDHLQGMLLGIKRYLDKIDDEEEQEQRS